MHQFKIGDRALLIPRVAGTKWEVVTVDSDPQIMTALDMYTGVRLPACIRVLVVHDEIKYSRFGNGTFSASVRRLIPLPKHGPDPEQDIARKLMEIHCGE